MGELRSLLKLKPFIRNHLLLFLIGIICTFLSSIISIPIPLIIGIILDKVLIRSQNYNSLYLYISLITIIYILQYIFSIISKYMFAKINSLVINELRYSILDKVIDLPMDYLSNTEKGYIQSRIAECSSISNIFSSSNINILVSVITAMLSIIAIFSINFKLSIVVCLLTPLFYFLSQSSTNSLMKHTKQMLEFNAILNGECFEIINGIEDIKILNGKNVHMKSFKNKLDNFVESSLKQNKTMLLFTENITAINNFGTLLILFISSIFILKNQFTIGLYTSFSLYSARIFLCSQSFSMTGAILKQACLSIDRVYELLDMKDENSCRNIYLEDNIESILFSNVTFKYKSNQTNIFNSLNLKINKGEKVFISGENGAGKSTLIKLILGLYDPIDGKILYNNLDSYSINRESLRKKIGIVSQSIFLFKGTVLENILYGGTHKNRYDVENIINKLNLQEYINRLPNGLDTEIAQNNSGISGGQSQVIAFIRLVLLNKDILILDEPISNVDFETKDIILNILKKFNFKGILIIISHLKDEFDFIDKVIELNN